MLASLATITVFSSLNSNLCFNLEGERGEEERERVGGGKLLNVLRMCEQCQKQPL